ncbi:hypothetical protein EIP91_002462 [Steccherinum ochraceum]|uniref:Uncharacterized protein n=1 Tax=Steccherinum ochraceum TaxID=92696 RepID=A0A4R0RII7_9APHY|nr:hypothetical protein EIP91_002462 [Steccherinum ochraceum]
MDDILLSLAFSLNYIYTHYVPTPSMSTLSLVCFVCFAHFVLDGLEVARTPYRVALAKASSSSKDTGAVPRPFYNKAANHDALKAVSARRTVSGDRQKIFTKPPATVLRYYDNTPHSFALHSSSTQNVVLYQCSTGSGSRTDEHDATVGILVEETAVSASREQSHVADKLVSSHDTTSVPDALALPAPLQKAKKKKSKIAKKTTTLPDPVCDSVEPEAIPVMETIRANDQQDILQILRKRFRPLVEMHRTHTLATSLMNDTSTSAIPSSEDSAVRSTSCRTLPGAADDFHLVCTGKEAAATSPETLSGRPLTADNQKRERLCDDIVPGELLEFIGTMSVSTS